MSSGTPKMFHENTKNKKKQDYTRITYISQDSQSGLSDALAGDVSLNLGLVDPIDTGPEECPSDGYGPKSVSPQRVHVKASVRGGKRDV